jgi:hypothetical protein
MTIISVPIKEVDGVPSNKDFFANGLGFQVCSHEDKTLVTLRFLRQTITVEASALQAAIRDCSPSQWDDHVTRSVR